MSSAEEQLPGVTQAAQQQQNDVQNVMSMPAQVPQNHGNPLDALLTCQWVGCGERCQSPELLYVSEAHHWK